MITALLAHPYPRFSVISIPLLEGLKEQFPQMDIRALYDLYPDSSIDLWEERKAVAHSSLILVVHPVFWNSVPALLKKWFDEVLAYGFAYGNGGDAVKGKGVLWIPSLGTGYRDGEFPGEVEISEVEAPIRRMWTFCGAKWLDPEIIDSRQPLTPEQFSSIIDSLADRIADWESYHV